MQDKQLLRYSRHILLDQIDIAGQQKLQQSHIAIVGLGGLGSSVALYLAGAGIGQLTLIDNDKVELSNLSRQIIHKTDSLGQSKVASAKQSILQLNPDIRVNSINQFFVDAIDDSALNYDFNLIIDACDNLESRKQINQYCFHRKISLISAAAIRFEALITAFDYSPDSPCYECLFKTSMINDESCTENGVVSPLVGILGSMQALEAIKMIIGIGQNLVGRVLCYDALYADWQSLKLKKRTDCGVCSTQHHQAK